MTKQELLTQIALHSSFYLTSNRSFMCNDKENLSEQVKNTVDVTFLDIRDDIANSDVFSALLDSINTYEKQDNIKEADNHLLETLQKFYKDIKKHQANATPLVLFWFLSTFIMTTVNVSDSVFNYLADIDITYQPVCLKTRSEIDSENISFPSVFGVFFDKMLRMLKKDKTSTDRMNILLKKLSEKQIKFPTSHIVNLSGLSCRGEEFLSDILSHCNLKECSQFDFDHILINYTYGNVNTSEISENIKKIITEVPLQVSPLFTTKFCSMFPKKSTELLKFLLDNKKLNKVDSLTNNLPVTKDKTKRKEFPSFGNSSFNYSGNLTLKKHKFSHISNQQIANSDVNTLKRHLHAFTNIELDRKIIETNCELLSKAYGNKIFDNWTIDDLYTKFFVSEDYPNLGYGLSWTETSKLNSVLGNYILNIKNNDEILPMSDKSNLSISKKQYPPEKTKNPLEYIYRNFCNISKQELSEHDKKFIDEICKIWSKHSQNDVSVTKYLRIPYFFNRALEHSTKKINVLNIAKEIFDNKNYLAYPTYSTCSTVFDYKDKNGIHPCIENLKILLEKTSKINPMKLNEIMLNTARKRDDYQILSSSKTVQITFNEFYKATSTVLNFAIENNISIDINTPLHLKYIRQTADKEASTYTLLEFYTRYFIPSLRVSLSLDETHKENYINNFQDTISVLCNLSNDLPNDITLLTKLNDQLKEKIVGDGSGIYVSDDEKNMMRKIVDFLNEKINTLNIENTITKNENWSFSY